MCIRDMKTGKIVHAILTIKLTIKGYKSVYSLYFHYAFKRNSKKTIVI